MKKIVLISCCSEKLTIPTKARELYISPLFKYQLEFSRRFQPNDTYILSAKYGLTELDRRINPYDQSLNRMSEKEKRIWAETTLGRLEEKSDLNEDFFIFLAGQNYRKHLIPNIANYSIPLEGLSIGFQLKYLKNACQNS